MSAMNTLIEHVLLATKAYRKGEVIKESDVGEVHVTEITLFPTAPELAMTVDVHFIEVGFTEAAAISHREFYDMVVAASKESGEFLNLSLDELKGGPSYITLGGWLGSQQVALQYLALGQLHGLWKVITPATLGATGTKADELAGMGMVMQGGLQEPQEVSA